MQQAIQTQDALSLSRDRFRNAFLTSSDSVAMVRIKDGEYCDINEMFSLFTGYSRAEILGASFGEIPLFQDMAEQENLFDDLNREGSIFNRVIKLHSKGNRVRTALLSTMVMPLDDELYVLLILRNIDDLQKAREALEVSEARFRELFNNMSSGVVVLQPLDEGNDFVLVDINRAAEHIEQVRREDLVGKSVVVAFPFVVKYGLMDVYKRVFKTGNPEHYPVSIYKGNELRVWKENYVYKLPSGEIIDVYDDVTERKQAEEQLFEYQEQLQLLTSELSLVEEKERRAIATDLHDHIGQTLSVIKMKCHSLKKQLETSPLKEEMEEVWNLVQLTIKDTRSLTFELSPPVLFELGLEPAIEWLAEHFHHQHGLDVSVSSDGQPRPVGEDFSILLFRSLRELLVNVVKHARADKVSISINVTDDRLNIMVEDDGRGFDTSLLEMRKSKEHAFGLFNIGERMRHVGGYFDVESSPGQGARMCLAVPLSPGF